jgi:hypothetical protein
VVSGATINWAPLSTNHEWAKVLILLPCQAVGTSSCGIRPSTKNIAKDARLDCCTHWSKSRMNELGRVFS